MKSILLLSTLMTLHTSAFAGDVFQEKLHCKVTSIDGYLSSYLPPNVGDEIILDTSLPVLKDLDFTNGPMIPIVNPLIKIIREETSSYMIYFQAEQHNSTNERGTLTVMAGKFRSPQGSSTRSVQIQDTTYPKSSGLTSTSSAILDCEEL